MKWTLFGTTQLNGAYSAPLSPLLASKAPVWRSKFLLCLAALGFLGLIAKAVYVQVLNKDFYQRQGELRFSRTLDLPANRGRVLDRNGLILASSVPAYSIWAIPEDVQASPAILAQLAELLGLSRADLSAKLKAEKTFVWLKRQVDDGVARKIAALGISGVHARQEYRRSYPEGEATAQLVGITNTDDKGQEGVELAFEKQLAGKPGSRRVIKDRLGRVVEDVGETLRPVDGNDVHLSIDSKIQSIAFQSIRDAVVQHQAKAGSVVVLDVASGEILALANYPSYQPAKRGKLSAVAFRNRALTDTFEPGSTMKPFIAAMALDNKWVNPETKIDTASGRTTVGGVTINDAHPHGVLSVNEVIQKSSNVGTVKMAMRAQPREMWQLYASLGFGQKPSLSFPGVVGGKLRDHATWRPIEQATMSYGYGLSVSLYQLARSYSVFARDGDLVPGSLVKIDQADPGVRVISPGSARAVRKMLQMATDDGGTAPLARTAAYSVAGKTGTARKQEGQGYADRRYRSWFVGFSPVEQPRIVVAVMVDEPGAGRYYGGEVAAPVFSATVSQTLRVMGVAPDITSRPTVLAQGPEESF